MWLFWAGLLLAAGAAWLGLGQCQGRIADLALVRAAQGQNGLTVRLYNNPFLAGKPRVSIRRAPNLHKPYSAKPYRPYPVSWRWSGVLEAPASGEYLITVYAAEAARLHLDGRPVLERWVASPPRSLSLIARLSKGPHLFDLQNVQETKRLDLSLFWAPPGAGQQVPIPNQAFRPLDRKVQPVDLDRLYLSLRSWRAATWALPAAWALLWFLFLARPGASLGALRQHAAFLLVLASAAVLRLAWGATVPGISGESAFFAWRADLILQGALPWAGMNTRVGPTFEYLLTLPTLLFGSTPWMLRGVGAGLNLLALVFCYRVLGREAGRPAALAGAALLATAPFAVAFARVPVEYCALLPLALFAGLDLFSLGRERPRLAWWGGVIWGLAMFTHPVFVMVPATAGLAALVISRLGLLKRVWFWAAGWGALLGFAPRLLGRWLFPAPDPMSFTDPARALALPAFLASFAQTFDGSLVYLLYTGQRLLPPLYLLPLALLAAVAWLFFRRRPGVEAASIRGRGLAWFALLVLGMQLLLTPVGAPSANPRYFLLSGLFALMAMALVFGLAWARASRPGRRALAGLLALLLSANLVYLGVNYFHGHLKNGGRTMAWENPWLDHTPDAWMNHRDLAHWLAKQPWPVVATADWWHHTLHLTLNLYRGVDKSFQAVDQATDSRTDTAAVFYNSWEGREMAYRFFGGHAWKRYQPVKLPPHLAGRYLVFKRVAPPVDFPPDLEAAP